MKLFSQYAGAFRRWWGLLPVLLLICPPTTFGSAEETFALLKTKTTTYTNVTVTKKTKDWIFILHSTGMVNLKVQDLPPETLAKLGLTDDPSKTKTEPVRKSNSVKKIFAGLRFSRVKDLEQQWQKQAPEEMDKIKNSPSVLYSLIIVLAFIYLLFAYCCRLICRKTHSAAGLLVWVPALQIIPLLRAANMSPMWFFAFVFPVAPAFLFHNYAASHALFVTITILFLPVLAQVVWSVKIVQARGKKGWIALFLLLPVTNLISFLYLAFSSAAAVQIKPESQLMALEVA